MALISRSIEYRCADDCLSSGCPGHRGELVYQSVSDAYSFRMNGRVVSFERGELDAMLELLKSLNRVDCVQVPEIPLTGAVQ